MVVRTLSPESAADIELYRAIRLESLLADPGAFGSTHEREVGFDRAEWRARLAGFGDRPGVVLVDELAVPGSGDAAQPAGTAAVGFPEWDQPPMLVGMWVRPSARGLGVARRLVVAATGWAAHQGADQVVLWVVRDNTPAVTLYERLGFRPTGDVKALPSDPCAGELEMRLDLAAAPPA